MWGAKEMVFFTSNANILQSMQLKFHTFLCFLHPKMIFLLALIFCPKMIFQLHFVTLQIGQIWFLIAIWNQQSTPNSGFPSIHLVINGKTIVMTKDVNQYYSFFFFASLWILPDWKKWNTRKQNKGPHMGLGIY